MLYNLDFAYFRSSPGGSDGKESACNAGDLDLICGKIPWRKAPPACLFAWKNPMEEGPGGLQSMRSQRVGHN